MNDKFTVLIDFDDVLADLLGAWVKWINKSFGTTVEKENIKKWDIKAYFPDLTNVEIFSPLSQIDFWETVEPNCGAVEFISRLILDDIKFKIVTASHYSTIQPKIQGVLFKYFQCRGNPIITWDDIIVCSEKQLIKGNILIDDGIHNLVNGEYAKILFTAPHNENIDINESNVLRANNFKEVYSYIEKIKAGKEVIFYD